MHLSGILRREERTEKGKNRVFGVSHCTKGGSFYVQPTEIALLPLLFYQKLLYNFISGKLYFWRAGVLVRPIYMEEHT